MHTLQTDKNHRNHFESSLTNRRHPQESDKTQFPFDFQYIYNVQINFYASRPAGRPATVWRKVHKHDRYAAITLATNSLFQAQYRYTSMAPFPVLLQPLNPPLGGISNSNSSSRD